MKKLWLIILVMAVAFVSIIATGGGIENKKASGIKTDGLLAERKASAEYVAMLGHSQVTSSPIHEGALYFAELVFEKTGGRVVVEVYPSAQLGAERDLIESVGMGAVTMGMYDSVHKNFYFHTHRKLPHHIQPPKLHHLVDMVYNDTEPKLLNFVYSRPNHHNQHSDYTGYNYSLSDNLSNHHLEPL